MRKNLHLKKDPMAKAVSPVRALSTALKGKRRVDGFKSPTRFGQ